MTVNPGSGGWPVPTSTGAPVTGAGTLGGAGTNNLQTSIDSLTNAVNNLYQKIGTLSAGTGTPGQQQGGTGTTQQFNRPVNPFGNPGTQVPGQGGGGPGGTANVGQAQPFGAGGGGRAASAMGGAGAIFSAFAGYGAQQMPTQLALNAVGAQTAMGMGGQTGTSFTAQYKMMLGMNGQGLNFMASSPMDAIQMFQTMQQVGAAANPMSTSIGRAGFGGAASVHLANPFMTGTQASQFSQQFYGQGFNYGLMQEGGLAYGALTRGFGNSNGKGFGQAIQGINNMFWTGQGTPSNKALYAGLEPGGKAYQGLLNAGMSAQQVQSLLPTDVAYATLFRKGYSASSATKLMTQASSGTLGQAKAAQAKLSSLGVSPATTSVQSLRNNQAVLSGRDADVANGFNTALQTSAGLLAQFNTDLSALMTTMHANGIIGGAGGIAGVASGMNFGNSLLGLSGAAILGSKLLGGGAGGALGAAAGRAAGAVGGAAGGGGLAATLGAGAAFLGPIGAAALLGHMIGGNVGKSLSVGSSLRTISGQNLPGQPEQHLGDLLKEIFSAKWGSSNTHPASVGGGAASVSQSLQTTASSNKQLGGGVTGQSVEAVHAAKSQIGVPYVYGDELPGVGFDCSGLVQWAYKQAGVNLPRTSQAQWAALSKSRSIPTGSAREGDLVFMAGSDGSYQAPGHVGLMISDNQLIQAPYTGANVQVIGYNPKEWQHAGRPTGRGGSLAVSGSGSAASAGSNTMSGTGLVGNSGMGIGGSYGSTEEADAISSALSGGGTGGVSLASGAGYGAAASGSGTGGPGASSTNPGGSASKNMAIAKMLAAKYGWTGQQWSDLDLLWMRESSWSNTARNASGAYGIPQALPASKLPLAGRPPSMGGKSNAGSQITWGLEYIKGRYGNPAGAWAHEESAGWYAAGGMIGSNMSIVGERGPELMIGGKGGQIVNNAQTMSILKAIQAQPAQTPWSNLDNMTTQPGQQNQMQGNTNLNFGNNSVVITVKSTGSDASASGREIAKSFTKWLEDEDIYESIRKGHKNG